jgi:hypothetical protein
MTPKRSFYRAATLTGAAAFLLAFAHVSPAAAQTTTPRVGSCIIQLAAGVDEGECTVSVPSGKRFVIETATVGGSMSSSQYARVQIFTKVNGVTVGHFVPAGYYNPAHNFPFWVGALPGKIMTESPNVKLRFTRGASTTSSAWMYLTVSGYLEDM